jgi:hypothetical protein
MKISFFFIAIGILFPSLISAQSIQNEVIATSGDSFGNSSVKLSWTLGECIVETGYTSGLTISQGFHQPHFKFSYTIESQAKGFEITIFPNPVQKFATVRINDTANHSSYTLNLYDLRGILISNREIIGQSETEIDLSRYQSDIMILKIARNMDGAIQTFKIVHVSNTPY